MMEGADLHAIQRLLSDFAWAADRGLADALSELFVADGTLVVNGQVFQGRAEIAGDCRRRAAIPNRLTRHVWSNLRLDARDDGSAEAMLVQLTYESTGPDRPVRLRISDVADRYERDSAGQWRIRSRAIGRQLALLTPHGA